MKEISIKELLEKYPDKVVEVYQRSAGRVCIQLDSCRIILNDSRLKRYASRERLNKQLRNNKYNQ